MDETAFNLLDFAFPVSPAELPFFDMYGFMFSTPVGVALVRAAVWVATAPVGWAVSAPGGGWVAVAAGDFGWAAED